MDFCAITRPALSYSLYPLPPYKESAIPKEISTAFTASVYGYRARDNSSPDRGRVFHFSASFVSLTPIKLIFVESVL